MGDILILGIGNTLMGDDGVGPAIIALLAERWDWSEEVALIDGGTRGVLLLPYVQVCRRLLLVDAIDAGCRPGTVMALDEKALIDLWACDPMGTHDTAAPQLLAMAEMLGDRPRDVAAIGVQPQVLGLRPAELSVAAAAALDLAAEAVVARVTAWGAAPVRRSLPRPPIAAHRPDAAVPRRAPVCEAAG